MRIHHIALVSEVAIIDGGALARVSAALQKQLVRDVAPVWEVTGTVDPFPALEDVPPGYWPIIISAAAPTGGLLGLHHDKDGQPVAWVEWSESWSITASHECIEMLVDPWGNYLQSAPSIVTPSAHVDYLVEVCDPCQSARYAYTINDKLVSDFYTPAYFDSIDRQGARYSFTGAIKGPRQVLDEGYLSWRDPETGEFWQVHGHGAPESLGKLDLRGRTLRQSVDALTLDHLKPTRLSGDELAKRVGPRRQATKRASARRAGELHDLSRKTKPSHRNPIEE